MQFSLIITSKAPHIRGVHIYLKYLNIEIGSLKVWLDLGATEIIVTEAGLPV